MSTLTEFLRGLLADGRIVFRSSPADPTDADRLTAGALLEHAFGHYRLDVAGPKIEFDHEPALSASELVRWSAWFLVSRQESAQELDRRLKLPGRPESPSRHLSADLVLRYLPQVLSRARAVDPADRLSELLVETLRAWPLSGVLADIGEPPTTPFDFDGHPGLLLLYAERLAQNERPSWTPADGAGREFVELVWQALGRKPPPAPAPLSSREE